MLKSVYIFIMSLFTLIPLYASEQDEPSKTVTVGNVRILPADQRVKISFTAEIDKKAVQCNYALTLTPVLVNGNDRVELRPLVIQGRKAKIAAKRQGMSARKQSSATAPIYSQNGKLVLYLDETKYEKWMEGAQLVMQKYEEGCCNIDDLPAELLANQVEVYPAPAIINVTEEPRLPMDSRTTGDRLVEKYPFLANVDKSSEQMESANSAVIYFIVGQSNIIDPEYMNNELTISNLINAINTVSTSKDSRIERIDITGYASPEGSLALNTQLAIKRAVSLKNYLLAHTPLKDSAFVLTNGSENWNGLREMVATSDMPEKTTILHIIDTAPIWDAKAQTGRLGQLMRLNQGDPYRYMSKNFFPKLRNTTCVKIYYRNL